MSKTVVVIPGFMQSALSDVNTINAFQPRGFHVWKNQEVLQVASGIVRMSLDSSGIGPAPGARTLITEGLPASGGLVLPVVAQLQLDGWTVQTHWWDWRKSLVQQAPLLADRLRSLWANGDFYVLAYSAGGLLLRLARRLVFRQDATPSAWKRTVYVAVPQYGTVSAALSLAFPDETLPAFGTFGTLVRGWESVLSGRDNTRAAMVRAIRQTLATFPGLYDLMPSINPPWDTQGEGNARLYVGGTYTSTNAFVKQDRLDAAKATRALLDASDTFGWPSERQVIGRGILTPDQWSGVQPVDDPTRYTRRDGDGVVVSDRATLARAQTAMVITGTDHADLFAERSFLQRVSSLLSDDTVPMTTAEPLPQFARVAEPRTTIGIPTPLPTPTPGTQTRNDP